MGSKKEAEGRAHWEKRLPSAAEGSEEDVTQCYTRH